MPARWHRVLLLFKVQPRQINRLFELRSYIFVRRIIRRNVPQVPAGRPRPRHYLDEQVRIAAHHRVADHYVGPLRLVRIQRGVNASVEIKSQRGIDPAPV